MTAPTRALDRAPHVEPADRAAWRRWLERNHASAAGVWLVGPRRRVDRGDLDYGAAVEEALCFGWIDGQAAGVDERRLKQYFAPRRPRSRWSKLNEERFQRMLAAGRVAATGLGAYERGPDHCADLHPLLRDTGHHGYRAPGRNKFAHPSMVTPSPPNQPAIWLSDPIYWAKSAKPGAGTSPIRALVARLPSATRVTGPSPLAPATGDQTASASVFSPRARRTPAGSWKSVCRPMVICSAGVSARSWTWSSAGSPTGPSPPGSGSRSGPWRPTWLTSGTGWAWTRGCSLPPGWRRRPAPGTGRSRWP